MHSKRAKVSPAARSSRTVAGGTLIGLVGRAHPIRTVRTPDIELTEQERKLYEQIRFGSVRYEDFQVSRLPMVSLSESLFRRKAVPDVRLRYFLDAERNPGGRGRSRLEIFEKNGTPRSEVTSHPHFMPYLQYFVCGPNLPASVLARFAKVREFSGYLTGGDVIDLIPEARAFVRSERLDPRLASEELHKLVLECGAAPFAAESIRTAVRSMKSSAR